MKIRTTVSALAALVALSCLLSGCNRDDEETAAGAAKRRWA